jgi:hypothetical protein
MKSNFVPISRIVDFSSIVRMYIHTYIQHLVLTERLACFMVVQAAKYAATRTEYFGPCLRSTILWAARYGYVAGRILEYVNWP